MTSIEKLNRLLIENGMSGAELCRRINVSTGLYSQWNTGKHKIGPKNLKKVADVFNVNVAELLDDKGKKPLPAYNTPTEADNVIQLPVIGRVAAGYDHFAEGDSLDAFAEIPISYLKGRSLEEFFVLRVVGDSMFPNFLDGDLVLVLKQETIDYSGQVAVVLYDDDVASLKKVEYRPDRNRMTLIPINPQYKPLEIEGERLNHCRILGVPKKLIRDLED